MEFLKKFFFDDEASFPYLQNSICNLMYAPYWPMLIDNIDKMLDAIV